MEYISIPLNLWLSLISGMWRSQDVLELTIISHKKLCSVLSLFLEFLLFRYLWKLTTIIWETHNTWSDYVVTVTTSHGGLLAHSQCLMPAAQWRVSSDQAYLVLQMTIDQHLLLQPYKRLSVNSVYLRPVAHRDSNIEFETRSEILP